MRKTLLAAAGAVVGLLAFNAPALAQDTIPVIVKDTTSPYWQTVYAGAKKAGAELKINTPLLGAQSEADVAGQISALENAVSEGPKAIVIAPTSFSALGPPIDEAAKKVKVVGIDSSADSKNFTSFLTTDNVAGGRLAADALAEAIKAKYGKAEGEVALLTYLPGAGSLDARDKGFTEELKAKYPDLKLVAHRIGDGQATTAVNIMTDLITARPNLRGVFGDNLFMGLGAGQAVAENHAQDKIKVVSFDSSDQLVKFLQDGAVAALIVQDPFRMGYQGVKTAYDAANGKTVPANIDTGANLITKANMDTPRSQELLHPKLN